MSRLFAYYRYYLEKPLYLASGSLGFNVTRPISVLYDVAASLVLVYLIYRVLLALWGRITHFRRDSEPLLDRQEYEALVTSRSAAGGVPTTAGVQAVVVGPPETVADLKRSKQYGRLGKVLSDLGRHKESAKWYEKAGEMKRAAVELALAGKKLRAAERLLAIKEFESAGLLFEEKGKHLRAAQAFLRGGHGNHAARAFRQAGKLAESASAYAAYFSDARDALETQLAAARDCLAMLESEAGRRGVAGPLRAELLHALAARFETAHDYPLAGRLFLEARDPVRAGEVYMLAGKYPEAAECMRAAGKGDEAARISGRYYESRSQWREAAAAFATAGDHLRAGDCWLKASELVNAGESFERGGDFHRAGMAFAQVGGYRDAIRTLQKVKESDPSFDPSRAWLGKCFYELRDWTQCAATLENHLTGKRVESGNVAYFYMLALALEQMGRLNDSRDILYKIRSVDVDFRDITERISSISSRISMELARTPAPAPSAGPDIQATQVMQVVENALDGRYHLERELGRGGMGVVYLARDTQLERAVALKFLGSLVDSSEEFRQRFVREARAAARISHPNIIAIYDISATAGKAYIAMEFVDGPSLARYVAHKGKLTAREAVNVISQACSALGAIHEAGIVHRDIKPDNILIGRGGLVKLTDFGLAKAEDARLTRAGTIMGTPSYMAPEQVLGKETDARSDLYSLGLVFHEILTGRTVFRDGDVLDRQLNEVPEAPSAAVEGIPPRVDEIVARCIAKDPGERYQKAGELLAALRQALA